MEGNGTAKQNGLVDRFENRVVSDQSVLSLAQYLTGQRRSLWFTTINELPPFTFQTIRAMLFEPSIVMGLAMREAPICNAEFGYRDGNKWVQGVYAANEEVARFVYKMLHRLWTYEVHKAVTAQVWGWSGGEIVWQLKNDEEFGRKMVTFDQLEPARSEDISVLKSKGEGVVGISVSNTRSLDNRSKVRLEMPKKGWFVNHKPEPGEPFGVSCLLGAYSPYADKWFNGGANDVRRLVMHKDAYAGMKIGFPRGATPVELEDGTTQRIPNQEIARKITENAKSGAPITYPLEYDEQNREKWKIEDAKTTVVPTHVLEYPKDLDIQMMRGMEIPDEVLISEMTGAWQGKKVPMLAFYGNLRKFGLQILRQVIHSAIEPAILMNFGKAHDFEVTLLPFDIQVMLTEQSLMPGGGPPEGGQDAMMGGMEGMMGGMGGDALGGDAASMMGPDYSMGSMGGEGLEFNSQQMSSIAKIQRIVEREAMLESDRLARAKGDRNVAYVSQKMSSDEYGQLGNETTLRAQKTIDRQLMMRGLVPYFDEEKREEIHDRRRLAGRKDKTFLMNSVPKKKSRVESSSWTEYSGPRGGSGWRHNLTKEIRYQEEMPDEFEDAVPGDTKVVSNKMTSEGKGPAGMTVQEAIDKAMGDSKAKRMNYDQSVAATYAYTGTIGADWTAVSIEGMQEVDDGEGGKVTMPKFSMPRGYKPVVTPFSKHGDSCELCGHKIKNNYYIKHDDQKLIMRVGSECVTKFSDEGLSGDRMAKKAVQEQNREFLESVWDSIRSAIKQLDGRGFFGKRFSSFAINWVSWNAAKDPDQKHWKLGNEMRSAAHTVDKVFNKFANIMMNSKDAPILGVKGTIYPGASGVYEAATDATVTRWEGTKGEDARKLLTALDESMENLRNKFNEYQAVAGGKEVQFGIFGGSYRPGTYSKQELAEVTGEKSVSDMQKSAPPVSKEKQSKLFTGLKDDPDQALLFGE